MARVVTTRKLVALTFDAGASAQGALPILATLIREQIPATFFLTGRFAETYPDVARQIASSGQLLGDHTTTHPHLPTLDDAAVRNEILVAAQIIARTTGRDPHPWFRFPFGESDGRTQRIVAALGFQAVGWTVDTEGWRGSAAGGPADVIRRVVDTLTPGAIILMHVGANPDDGTTYDADALPQLIAAIRAAGYGFTTVAGDVVVR